MSEHGPTACTCGSTKFEVIKTRLTTIQDAGNTRIEDNTILWGKVCRQCSQVTLWAEEPVKWKS